MEILTAMTKANVVPNLITFNSVLEVLSKSTNSKFSRQCACRIMAEMKRLGIKPSLGTYYLLLSIFGSSKEGSSSILYEIMDEIKNEHFSKIEDKRDSKSSWLISMVSV